MKFSTVAAFATAALAFDPLIAGAAYAQNTQATATPKAALESSTQGQGQAPTLEDVLKRVHALEERLAERDRVIENLQRSQEKDASLEKAIADLQHAVADKIGHSGSASAPAAKPKWYDKLSIRGYTQVRYTTLLGRDNTPDIHVPADPSSNEAEFINIRRGRVILSGDVTDHLFMYAQMEFNGSVGPSGGATGLQMRDLYGDIAVDPDKEFRFRVGESKIPFGWVNLQSSQNRGPIERPDALNSAAEGERDFGAFFYWAPKETRALFQELVRSGLKGSGDYGVLGIGVYSGQGPNRPDVNGEPHTIARASYPFHITEKQIVEIGANAYTGHYVPSVGAIGGVTPTFTKRGVKDQRYGVTAVWYPQPFGLEAEWNWGRGPERNNANTLITDEWLQGGYVQASFLEHTKAGTFFPFIRWNYFDGSRKFARNAPEDKVNEFDFGTEWSPWPEVEVTLVYTRTLVRTNTNVAPFDEARGEDRVTMQVQVNF